MSNAGVRSGTAVTLRGHRGQLSFWSVTLMSGVCPPYAPFFGFAGVAASVRAYNYMVIEIY